MVVVYIHHANGAKSRKVFWNIAEAGEFCDDLQHKGYKIGNPEDGVVRAEFTS